jgi:hypothetical protein
MLNNRALALGVALVASIWYFWPSDSTKSVKKSPVISGPPVVISGNIEWRHVQNGLLIERTQEQDGLTTTILFQAKPCGNQRFDLFYKTTLLRDGWQVGGSSNILIGGNIVCNGEINIVQSPGNNSVTLEGITLEEVNKYKDNLVRDHGDWWLREN